MSEPTPRLRKTLVAVVEIEDGEDLFEGPSEPRDGEPVGLPEPCARLRAGYWCSCGGSFRTVRHRLEVQRARVELMPESEQPSVPFLGDYWSDPDVPPITHRDHREVDERLAGLSVGTIVERHGTTFRERFHPRPYWRDPLQGPLTGDGVAR
jgi:hypothetical protein